MATRKDVLALKERFKTGSTPTEADYGKLIDMASVGLKALGVPNDSLNPADAKIGNGLKYTDGNLAVVLAKNSGLVLDNGLKVLGGPGISVTESGIGLKVKAPLSVNDTGDKSLKINHIPPIELQFEKGTQKLSLGVKIDSEHGGLVVDNGALRLNIDEAGGLKFDGNKLAIKRAAGENFLEIGPEGLQLTQAGLERLRQTVARDVHNAIRALLSYDPQGAQGEPDKETLQLPYAAQLHTTLTTALRVAIGAETGSNTGWSFYITAQLKDALTKAVAAYPTAFQNGTILEHVGVDGWVSTLTVAVARGYAAATEKILAAWGSVTQISGVAAMKGSGSFDPSHTAQQIQGTLDDGLVTAITAAVNTARASSWKPAPASEPKWCTTLLNALAEAYKAGEAAHKGDYDNGYDKGKSAGEAAHKNDYDNGYDKGKSAGEAAHKNDYDNGYSKGKSDGAAASYAEIRGKMVDAMHWGYVDNGWDLPAWYPQAPYRKPWELGEFKELREKVKSDMEHWGHHESREKFGFEFAKAIVYNDCLGLG